MVSILIFTVIIVVLIGIAVTCDFSAYSLTESEIKLLYNDEQNSAENTNTVFGDSTKTGVINETDLQSSEITGQAEELLQQIYDSR